MSPHKGTMQDLQTINSHYNGISKKAQFTKDMIIQSFKTIPSWIIKDFLSVAKSKGALTREGWATRSCYTKQDDLSFEDLCSGFKDVQKVKQKWRKDYVVKKTGCRVIVHPTVDENEIRIIKVKDILRFENEIRSLKVAMKNLTLDLAEAIDQVTELQAELRIRPKIQEADLSGVEAAIKL